MSPQWAAAGGRLVREPGGRAKLGQDVWMVSDHHGPPAHTSAHEHTRTLADNLIGDQRVSLLGWPGAPISLEGASLWHVR